MLSFAPYPTLNHHFASPLQINQEFRCFKKRISVQSSLASSPNSNQDFAEKASTQIIHRHPTNFRQSVWGDRFITHTPSHITYDACREHVEGMKQIRRMLATNPSEPSKKIRLIDSLQRLGVAYHFEVEIEKVLEQIHDGPNYGFDVDNDDIHKVALQFRLLRQQGYNVPCDVFSTFKNSDGNFKEDLINDVNSMLCLYEATHLRVHGEDILNEALEFTTTRLKSILPDLKPPLATQVMHALRIPLHMGMPRLEARHYISVYQETGKTKNESLLNFAKQDFNLLQSMYQQELSQLSRWWKELGVESKFHYARDRLVESYLFAVGINFEPQYALARKFFTKFSAVLTIVDDTYDTYGTFEELQLFTDAIERWDISAVDELPEYMKQLYSILLNLYNETKEELTKEGRPYYANYVAQAVKALIRAYFIEAKWFNDGYIPTIEEYMQIAIVTSTMVILPVICLVGMGDVVTREALDWVMDVPKLVKAASIHVRLLDDTMAHKFEKDIGKFRSAVDYYMKQYHVSEQEVYDEFFGRMTYAWKDINQACMKPTAFAMPVLLHIINYVRATDALFLDEDGYTHVTEETKEFITSLFIDPICT